MSQARLIAENDFVHGDLHPDCPNCGRPQTRATTDGVRGPDGNIWKRYDCACGEVFTATIEVGLGAEQEAIL